MPVRLLVDLDALAKLSHWELEATIPQMVGGTFSHCATVTSAAFRARAALAKPDKVFRSPEAAQRALDAVEQMTTPPEPSPQSLAVFQGRPDIDAGEAVLLANMLDDPTLLLLTGDKRCLRGVCKLSEDIIASLCGRVLIVEQVVERAIQTTSFAAVQGGVRKHPEIDKAVAACFGSQGDAPLEAVTEGLDSYIREMGGLHNPSLLYDG